MNEDYVISPEAAALISMFPEAKLTIRDKVPINLILTSAILTIQKSILNIDYSEEELRESILGFVAMIPDELKDEAFNQELDDARQQRLVNTRPMFCEVPASDEYCQKHGIETVHYVETFDYFKVFHACFNLLHRRKMLFKFEEKTFGDSTATAPEEDTVGKETTESDEV